MQRTKRAMHLISLAAILGMVLFSAVSLPIPYVVMAAIPMVVTDAATNISLSSAFLNGNITSDGGENITERGFVWDTSSQSVPNSTTPPNATLYSGNWTESGSFGVGAFDHNVTSLSMNVTYYYRSAAYNAAGWDYGEEMSFHTLNMALDAINMLDASVQLSLSASSWYSMNVSDYVADGATGAILQVVVTLASQDIGFRKPGSTQDFKESLEAVSGDPELVFSYVGLDANGTFEYWTDSSTYIEIYLVGYFGNGVTFFTNFIDKIPVNKVVYCSAQAPNATGLLWWGDRNGYGSPEFSVRHPDIPETWMQDVMYQTSWAIAGCNESQACKVYRVSTVTKYWLIGYITEGVNFYTDAYRVVTMPSNGWQSIRYEQKNSEGFLVAGTGYQGHEWGFRPIGSSEDVYAERMTWTTALVGCNETQYFDTYVGITSVMYLTGWFGDVTLHSDMKSTDVLVYENSDNANTFDSGRTTVRQNDGTLWVSYREIESSRYNLIVMNSMDNGTTWGNRTTIQYSAITGSVGVEHSALVVDDSDNVHCIYSYANRSSSPIYGNLYHRIYWTGNDTWTSSIPITYDSQNGYANDFHSIKEDSGGDLHLVWAHRMYNGTLYYRIEYMSYNGTWSSVTSLTNYSSDFESYSDVSIDVDDDLHVVFESEDQVTNPGSEQIMYTKYNGTWSVPIVLEGNATAKQEYPSIACRVNTTELYVSWVDAGGKQVMYKCYNGSGWESAETIVTRSYSQRQTSISVNESGNIWLYWHGNGYGNFTETCVQYTEKNGTDGSWITIGRLSPNYPPRAGLPSYANASQGANSMEHEEAVHYVMYHNQFDVMFYGGWCSQPSLDELEPTYGARNNMYNIAVNGSNMWSRYTNATSISFGSGITVNGLTTLSYANITVNITIAPGASLGYRNVTFSNADYNVTLVDGFNVIDAPDITGFIPFYALLNSTTEILVLGNNFDGILDVTFGAGITVNSWNVINSTNMTVNITVAPAAYIWTRNVTVTNSEGVGFLDDEFRTRYFVPHRVGLVSNDESTLYGGRHITRTDDLSMWAVWSEAGSVPLTHYVAKSTDYGDTWTNSTISADGFYGIAIAAHEDDVYVIWSFVNASTMIGNLSCRIWSNSSQTWSSDELVFNMSNDFFPINPDVAIDSSGNVYVSCVFWDYSESVNSTVEFVYRDSDTGIWSSNTTIYSTLSIVYPDTSHTEIDARDNGDVHVVWQGSDGNSSSANVSILYRSRLSGIWGSVENVAPNYVMIDGYYPTIVLDGSGIPHVSWFGEQEANSSYIEIKYNSRTGSSWGNAIELTSINNTDGQSSPSISEIDDDIYVFWFGAGESGDDGAGQLRCIINNGTWGDWFFLTNEENVDSIYPKSFRHSPGFIFSEDDQGADINVTIGLFSDYNWTAPIPQDPPIVTSVSPAEADEEETLIVTISGINFIGTTSVSFGNGITIVVYSVTNSTSISVTISVSDNAVIGYRDVSITTPSGTGILSSGFYVSELALTTTGQLVGIIPLVLIAIVLVFLVILIATGNLVYALISGAIAAIIGVGILVIVLDLVSLVD